VKRTPLRRKTPLRPSSAPTRGPGKSPTWRPPRDGLTSHEFALLRKHVIDRDVRAGGCVIAILAAKGRIEGATPCQDGSGRPISPRDRRFLTYEHVKPAAGMSLRAPGDPRWGVAACWYHNAVSVETSKYRPAIRERLARLEQEGRL